MSAYQRPRINHRIINFWLICRRIIEEQKADPSNPHLYAIALMAWEGFDLEFTDDVEIQALNMLNSIVQWEGETAEQIKSLLRKF